MGANGLTHHGTAFNLAAAEVARRLGKPTLSPASVSALAFGVDAGAVGLALGMGQALASDASGTLALAGLAALGSGLLTAAAVVVLRGYRLAVLRRFWRGWAMAAGLAALVAAVGAAAGIWADWRILAAPAVLLFAVRAVMATFARWVLDFGLTDRRAVIVGGGAEAERLIRGLAANPDNDIRILGLFDDRDDARSPPVVVATPKLGDVADLIGFVRVAEVDMLILALPLTAEARIRPLLDQLRVLPVDVRLSAYSADFSFHRRGDARGLIGMIRRPLDGWRWLVKRGLDASVAALALVVLSPLLLAAAVAVKLDSRGPVFFRQQRHGYNNRPVAIWKFRSMHVAQSDPTARQVVTREDPRVTRVGRFIRRWSIDELPQLWNVLRGELSLVGPRPHVLDAVSSAQRAFEEIVEGYAARHRVPPGLTGWAQINGWRGEIDAPEKLEQRVAHDLYYIENWSIWFDLYVLAITPLRLLDSRGAY
jgi:Undecaprenyl-phosphate glucose phosphotransferase